MHLCQQDKAHSTFAFSTALQKQTENKQRVHQHHDKKEESPNFPLPILLIIILMIPITALRQVE